MTTSPPSDGNGTASDQTRIDIVRIPAASDLTSDPPTGPTGLIRPGPGSCVELPPGSVVDEIYEIDARLGAGAMGEVYAARHLRLGKRVAIKVIGQRLSEDTAAIERFAMEARTLAQIQHPAIVAVEHVGELADGRAYFVMEFLRGESLFDRLYRGRVPFLEALRVLDQMARGLDAAHGEGVTHRDLKPENTFLVHLPGEPPIIKLVDFGLAKLRVADLRTERTQSGVAIGTPMYMSPEQMRGQGVDHRTDVYALGCVAYELVLGQPPFPHANTAPELYAAHLHESPPLPRSIWPEIPPQLDLCLFAMLAKDPAQRPTLPQVRSILAGAAAQPPRAAPTLFVRPRSKKTRGRALVGAALIGGILIGALLASRTSGEPSREPSPTASAQPPFMPPKQTTGSAEILTQSPKQPPIDSAGSASTARSKPVPPVTPVTPATPIRPVTPIRPKPPDPRPQNPPRILPLDRNQILNPFEKRRVKHDVQPTVQPPATEKP